MKAISVENVSKRFILKNSRSISLADGLRGMVRKTPREEFWALKGVNLEVECGGALGIIGHNGAGKSTLLKLLTRIMDPSSGRVRTRGRVSALIEVGAGFHPEMTGRENIYLNGSVLGMGRREITRKFDDIVAFAEVEQFIDTPVKRYSSGMYARLGFAVLAHLEPDILLVDEVLSVGDERFQLKCQTLMSSLMHSGVTVLFVSHNLPVVISLCRTSVLLDHGRVVDEGDSAAMVRRFREMSARPGSSAEVKAEAPRGPVRIDSIRVLDSSAQPVETVNPMDRVRIEVTIAVDEGIDEANFGLEIERTDGVRCFVVTSAMDGFLPSLTRGTHNLVFEIEELSLVEGDYVVSVGIMDRQEVIHYSTLLRGAHFSVMPEHLYRGVAFLKHSWDVSQQGSIACQPAQCHRSAQ